LTIGKTSAREASEHFGHHGRNRRLVHIFLRGEATKDTVVGEGPADLFHALSIVDLDLASFRVCGDDGHEASLFLVAVDGAAADRHLEVWRWVGLVRSVMSLRQMVEHAGQIQERMEDGKNAYKGTGHKKEEWLPSLVPAASNN
jgi:hypothetical protein